MDFPKDDVSVSVADDTLGDTSVTWGPWTAVVGGLLLYLTPQVIIGVALYVLFGSEAADESFVSSNETVFNTLIYALAGILTVLLLFATLRYKQYSIRSFGLMHDGLKKIWYAVPAFGVYLFITILVSVIAGFFVSNETLSQQQELGIGDVITRLDMLVAFVSLVIIAPFVEELLFRGFVYKGLRQSALGTITVLGLALLLPSLWGIGFGLSLLLGIQRTVIIMIIAIIVLRRPITSLYKRIISVKLDERINITAAIIVSAVLFGLAHLQLNVGLDTFALGIVLAYLAETTNSLWPSIALHSLKNLVAFLALFVFTIG